MNQNLYQHVTYVIKSPPSKFWQKEDLRNTMNTEFRTLFEWFM